MADELGAELSLDLDSARREVEAFRRDLEDELERAVQSFSTEYERAVGDLPTIEPDIDSRAVTEELTRAVKETDSELEVTTDSAAITSDINEAVGATSAIVEADTGPLVASLIDVVESTHPQLTPELDTSAVRSALDDLSGADAGGDLAAGFDDAQLQAQDLADTLSDLQSEGGQTSDSLGNVSNVSTTLATAFSAAKGDGQRLIESLAQIRGGLGSTVAAGVALTAGFTALFAAGEHALQSVERAQVVLGDAAGRIEHIDVGGLTGSLSELAIKAGQSGGALRQAATSAAQMGLTSGKSVEQVTEFANKVNALALRAVALNPALGDAGNVAERLNLVLGRGGRFLNRYQIDLTSAEITTRALAETGKTAVRDLTSFERSVAGADIAVEKLGNNLGTDFAKGADTATVRLASIRSQLAAAFAKAGEPLVEPTITGFQALATAGTELSKALGSLGAATLPVVTAGLETIGSAAGVAAEAVGAIPGPVLAAGAALVILGRSVETAVGGANLASVAGFKLAMSALGEAMQTTTGRSITSLVALTALDQGLGALGTSTKELGIDFVTTGAAIGFAIAGPQGAAGGAVLGAIAQAISAESDLSRATREVQQEFKTAESGSGDLREALFANATTALDLAAAIAGLDINLGKFIQDASAFKALGVTGDLHALGLSAQQVGDLARQGTEGLATFIDKAQQAGKIGTDLRKILEKVEFAGTFSDTLRATNEKIDELGVGAHLTGEEFVGLTKKQQDYILAALKSTDSNTKLIAAFETLQKQIPAAEKAQFDLVAQTNHLSPALREAAIATTRNADGSRNYVEALKVLSFEVQGLLPDFKNLTRETAIQQQGFHNLTGAIDAAAKSIPGINEALSQGLDTSFFEDLSILNPVTLDPKDFIHIGPTLDTGALLGNLDKTKQDTVKFFQDVATIADAGASDVAASLLALGPSNLGARVAADLAANQPLFREGMEKALEGMAQAQVVADTILATIKAKVALLGSDIGGTLEARLKAQFNVTDISQLSTAQIVAFVQSSDLAGTAAGKAIVDAYNRQVAAEKFAGIDTKPLTDSVEAAKDSMGRTLNAIPGTVDEAMAQVEAHLAAGAPPAFAVIGQAVDEATLPVPTTIDEALLQAQAVINSHAPVIKRASQFAFAPIGQAVDDATLPIPTTVDEAMLQAQARINAATPGFYDAGAGAGEAITTGIAVGIAGQRALDEAKFALGNVLEQLDAEAHAYLGASLVSRRFKAIGETIPRGLAAGITSEMPNTINAFTTAMGGLDFGGGAVRGMAPGPPAGATIFQPQIMVDGGGGSWSHDQSISVGTVNNYGPDPDTRGAHLTRKMRSYQYLYAGT